LKNNMVEEAWREKHKWFPTASKIYLSTPKFRNKVIYS
jgi:hypothetical protein